MLLDKDIREPLFDFLEERYGKVRILEEKTVGNSRADDYKFSFAAFKPLLKTFRTEIVLKNGSESAFDFMRQIHYFSLTSRDRLGKKKFEMQQKWAAKGKCLRHSRKTADFLP